MTDHKLATYCANALAGLAEPHRIRIIECLRSGSKNVTQLSRMTNVELVNVSHHLSVLRKAELVKIQKRGRFVIYSLNPEYFKTNEKDNVTTMDLGWCKVEIPHF
jgi:ArsR family transcriptional regulator